MKKAIALLVGTALGLQLSACGGTTKDGKAAWNDVIKHCASSSLNGPKILYFGPSNAIGAGSIWRMDPSDKVFRLRYDLSQMPDPKNFTAPANELSCDGTASKSFAFGIEAGLDATPVSGALKADLKRAQSVEAKASSIEWVPIAEGPYEAYVNGLPAASGPRTDLLAGDKYVLTRALKIKGFSTTLGFTSATAASLKAKYGGPMAGNLAGNLNGGLSASWTADNKLTIASANDFYIAGEFQKYNGTGLSGQTSPFAALVDVPAEATPTREPPQ